jgi:pyridoxamine 5'-phosphate oxidase
MNPIADIRKDYKLRSLSELDVAANPIDQFIIWWNEAIACNIDEVNAMTLATADDNGRPHARIVLLKGMSENGFEFFTNYDSSKGKEMAANNKVALVFFWKELERQIRIEGTVSKLSEAESDKYFLSRPWESRLGAWASPQSSIIENREVLDENVLQTRATFEGKEIVRPPFWGGYIVQPESIEFWQGRSNRLHDRIAYLLKNDIWSIKRLAP